MRAETRALLRALARDDCLLGFATAVTAQLAHPLGAADPSDDEGPERERRTAARLAPVLAAARGDAIEDAATTLADDAPLLAACYQNLDLLPTSGCAAGDHIARLVGRALELLAERPR